MSKIYQYITSSQLSQETGYSANAIRIKRKNQIWKAPEIFTKKNNKLVEISIFGYNNWCANGNSLVKFISFENIQFVRYSKFKSLYKITITELSRFCEYVNIDFNSLLVIAPDGNRMINLDLYQKNIYSLLKFLKVI